MPARRSSPPPLAQTLLDPALLDPAPTEVAAPATNAAPETGPAPKLQPAEAAQPVRAAGSAIDALEGRRTVLVAIVNNQEDLARAAVDGWYRIPQRRAPRRIGADYLALYLTGAIEGEGAHSVAWYAPTRRYRLLARCDLIPDEPNHPRANDSYFRIDIGPLRPLQPPVPAASYRRLTFIHTTLEQLLSARDVTELFRKDDPFDLLWDSLLQHKLRPLKNRIVSDRAVDIALRARGGMLSIRCSDELTVQEARAAQPDERWQLLTLHSAQIEQDMSGCLRRIGSALLQLGGSMLNG